MGSGNLSEDLLIQRAVAGEAAALAILLLKHEEQLLAYVRRRLPVAVQSFVEPEDVVQEASYEACRMIQGFLPQGPNSFYRWLTRIANLRIRATIQKFRSRRTHAVSAGLPGEASVLAALEQLAVYRRTPSASAAMHEFAASVESSLQRLNADYQAVILHRYISGLTVEETARRMNRDSAKVYVLCSRAISALRAQMASASHFT